jgi:hypothetical protein
MSASSTTRRGGSSGQGGGQRDGQIGSGPNWIERSFPVDTNDDQKIDPKAVIEYDLGIDGISFGVGPLSRRMYDAIVSRSSTKISSEEIRRMYSLYSMDFSAKEAVRAALKQNGLEMVLRDDEQDEGLWAYIDAVKLLDCEGERARVVSVHDGWESAVNSWTPGQPFHFVARQVPAKMRELELDELLQALDPDGSLRMQARSAGMRLPDDEIATLRDLADENVRRVESAPRGAVDSRSAFSGNIDSRGYQPIRSSDLLYDSMNADGTEHRQTLMHVMDALVSHGALLVDLSDGGTVFAKPEAMSSLWKATEHFFDRVSREGNSNLPAMTTALETGSHHAKVGFASYDNGNLQFLETRLSRSGELLPPEAVTLLSEDGSWALKNAFKLVARVGQDVVRIATAAATAEAGALQSSAASDAALLLALELVDDAKPLNSNILAPLEGSVSMSPHRLCRYMNNPKSREQSNSNTTSSSSSREIFGAHTDSTFITAVPVAAVAGLEVYDEGASQWYRPELAAWKFWQAEQARRKRDPDALTETLEDGTVLPWYARYIVLMPGEMLQLVTRSEVLAAVHRVVATEQEQARLSAPILLRGRPGTILNVERYLGGVLPSVDSVLNECNGMTIEQIHDAMQPSSVQREASVCSTSTLPVDATIQVDDEYFDTS